MSKQFGERLRELRKERSMTLRELAEAAGVDFTYLSKIENCKPGYSPGAGTIRALAGALGADTLELLELADKVPPEVARFAGEAKARRFFERATKVASPEDWEALLDFLEARQAKREGKKK